MNSVITYFTYAKTGFVRFDYLYGECFSLIEKYEQTHPLLCLKADCPANRGCMEVLAKRVHYFFEVVEPEIEVILSYFKYRDRENTIRAGVFPRDLSEPRLITLNRSGFSRYQKIGDIKQWTVTSEYVNINGIIQLPKILPVESLIRK